MRVFMTLFALTALTSANAGHAVTENFETPVLPQGGVAILNTATLDSTTITEGHYYDIVNDPVQLYPIPFTWGPGLVEPGVRIVVGQRIQWNGAGYHDQPSKSIHSWGSRGITFDFDDRVSYFSFNRYGWSPSFSSMNVITVYSEDDLSILETLHQFELAHGSFFEYENSAGIGKVTVVATSGSNSFDNLVFNPTAASCSQVLEWSVGATPAQGGTGMTAVFTPNFGLSLDSAAGICGVDHFNWLQWVTFDDDPQRPTINGTQPPVPYLDPPFGGWDYLSDDLFAGYFNEITELGAFTDEFQLRFADYPAVSSAPYRIRFKTMLAGVEADYTTFGLGGRFFEWETSSVGTVRAGKNLDESIVVVPWIELLGDLPVTALGNEDIQFLRNQGVVIVGAPIFRDGFESSGTSAWSSSLP